MGLSLVFPLFLAAAPDDVALSITQSPSSQLCLSFIEVDADGHVIHHESHQVSGKGSISYTIKAKHLLLRSIPFEMKLHEAASEQGDPPQGLYLLVQPSGTESEAGWLEAFRYGWREPRPEVLPEGSKLELEGESWRFDPSGGGWPWNSSPPDAIVLDLYSYRGYPVEDGLGNPAPGTLEGEEERAVAFLTRAAPTLPSGQDSAALVVLSGKEVTPCLTTWTMVDGVPVGMAQIPLPKEGERTWLITDGVNGSVPTSVLAKPLRDDGPTKVPAPQFGLEIDITLQAGRPTIQGVKRVGPQPLILPVAGAQGGIGYEALGGGDQELPPWLIQPSSEDVLRSAGPAQHNNLLVPDLPWKVIISEANLSWMEPALSDLIERREGSIVPFPVLRSGDKISSVVDGFLEDHAKALKDEARYILIAGQPKALPWDLQKKLVLGLNRFVGRICFPSAAGYRAYAKKVVKAETEQAELASIPRFIGLATDHDYATQVSLRSIYTPIQTHLDRQGQFLTEHFKGSEATWELALKQLEARDRDQLFLSISHGVYGQAHHRVIGAPADQRGWPLRGEWLPESPLLPNGVAVLFGCNTGGVNGKERQLLPSMGARYEGEIDRAAYLPQALLQKENGPLAVVAHVDPILLWGLSDSRGNLPTSIASPAVEPVAYACTSILKGRPLSIALRSMVERSRTTSIQAMGSMMRRALLEDPEALENVDLLKAIRAVDAANWVLFGDPRVCLGGRVGQATMMEITMGGEDV